MKMTNWMKVGILACCLMMNALGAQAQDLKSILSGIAKTVGEKVSEKIPFSVEGTWTYVGQDCQFTSDNLLAQAGGEVASQTVETKMQELLDKLGFSDGCTFVFNADGTYSSAVKGRTTQGTYTFDTESKELKMKTSAGISFTTTASYNVTEPNKMSLLFNADKLMQLAQTVSSAASLKSSSSTLKMVSSLLGNYNGLQVGFQLEKQQ